MSEWGERLRPVLDEEGVELLDAQVSGGRRSQKLRFFVDRSGGIGIEDLARLSRKIGLLLDADLSLVGSYELEVSSPGMHRVVRTEDHFRRFAGERVHVWTLVPIEGRTHLEGVIGSCAGGAVQVVVEGLGPVPVRLDQIDRAELRLDPRRPAGGGGAAGRARRGEVPDHGE